VGVEDSRIVTAARAPAPGDRLNCCLHGTYCSMQPMPLSSLTLQPRC